MISKIDAHGGDRASTHAQSGRCRYSYCNFESPCAGRVLLHNCSTYIRRKITERIICYREPRYVVEKA
jgi:hypothetical protein